MATLADLQARRDRLVARRESLVRRIETGDKTVEYDLSAADDALRELDRQIDQARAGAGAPRPRRIYVRTCW